MLTALEISCYSLLSCAVSWCLGALELGLWELVGVGLWMDMWGVLVRFRKVGGFWV